MKKYAHTSKDFSAKDICIALPAYSSCLSERSGKKQGETCAVEVRVLPLVRSSVTISAWT